MTNVANIGLSLAQLALIAGQKRSIRSLGGIVAQLVQDENHVDELEVTDHPVEQGASITDHAFKLPSTLTLRYAWSQSPSPSPGLRGLIPNIIPTAPPQDVHDIYTKLLTMQANRELLTVYTGKRSYRNMLIQRLEVDTDQTSEYSLPTVVTLRELLLVTTQTASSPGVGPSTNPADTTYPSSIPTQQGGTFQLLPGMNYRPGLGPGGLVPFATQGG